MQMTRRKHTKLVHEGDYVAEVKVELIDEEEGWGALLVGGGRSQARRGPQRVKVSGHDGRGEDRAGLQVDAG